MYLSTVHPTFGEKYDINYNHGLVLFNIFLFLEERKYSIVSYVCIHIVVSSIYHTLWRDLYMVPMPSCKCKLKSNPTCGAYAPMAPYSSVIRSFSELPRDRWLKHLEKRVNYTQKMESKQLSATRIVGRVLCNQTIQHHTKGSVMWRYPVTCSPPLPRQHKTKGGVWTPTNSSLAPVPT